ncbi:hypothetical protein [Methylobacterium oryzisoli]|uniref:hypothetical protein n=1 Tax=Methylobacterium oryzisoli TaxID=3385502 RepID=UPI003892BC67
MTMTVLAPETTALIRDLVMRELPGARDTAIDVRVDEDHDGDDAIMVRIAYDDADTGFDPKAAARMVLRLNAALSATGESRFAYVSYLPGGSDA